MGIRDCWVINLDIDVLNSLPNHLSFFVPGQKVYALNIIFQLVKEISSICTLKFPNLGNTPVILNVASLKQT